MKWWKRLLFSAVSLVLGFVSLDYLIYAFRLLTDARNQTGEYAKEDIVGQLLGAFLFFLWFVILSFYYYVLRKSSNQIDLVEWDEKTGKSRVRKKWFDILLQAAFLVTGIFIRWCYLMFIYLPAR